MSDEEILLEIKDPRDPVHMNVWNPWTFTDPSAQWKVATFLWAVSYVLLRSRKNLNKNTPEMEMLVGHWADYLNGLRGGSRKSSHQKKNGKARQYS